VISHLRWPVTSNDMMASLTFGDIFAVSMFFQKARISWWARVRSRPISSPPG
jgi:hypothetical protein